MIIYNDYELLYLIKRGNETALELLLEKYKIYLISILKKYNVSLKYKEDIVQECLLELFVVIKKFDESYNALFYSYIQTIFKRKIDKLLIKYYKHEKVTSYFIEQSQAKFKEEQVSYNTQLDYIEVESVFSDFVKELNEFEQCVLKEILINKKSIASFCTRYNVEVKKVYNAIQYIRKKYNKLR